MRIARLLPLGLLTLGLASPASAASTAAGSSLLAIQLSRGVADLVTPSGGTGEITWFNRPELGAQAQYWYFIREDYAVTLTAGIGYFKQSDTGAPGFGATDFRLTSNSWQVRLGGDRFANVSDKLQIFAGPGIGVWGGKFEIEGAGESPSALRWTLSGRIGANMVIGQNFGLIGHIGQYWGYLTAEDEGAETKVLPSGTEGAMGFSFGF